ncbi:MAG TPA: DivIVA domain-containing protein [Acidimicrobiales bacterium]|jgi:hypothetical protein|nr:DivIVA domain-containing protein [Acidimicrobiales bacterium]
MNPDDLASKSFNVVRKGFDTNAVRSLLIEVADELRSLRSREAELERRLAEPVEVAPSAPVDEKTLVSAVGSETAKILQAAHDAAREIAGRAERQAAALVADAEGASAERTRLAAAEATELRTNAHDEVLALEQKAREACRKMVDEAREARRRILSDLVDRRRALHLQLEQMRAGKDALAQIIDSVAYSVVASVEEVRARLEGSEEAARLAAASATIGPQIEEELALDALEIAELGEGTEAATRTSTGDDGLDAPLSAQFAESDPAAFADVERSDADAVESDVGAGIPSAESEPDGERAPDPGPSSEIDALFDRIRNAGSPVDAVDPEVMESAVEGASAEDEPSEPEADVDESIDWLARRDQLLGPAAAELGRALKRALRVEENELRDTARHLPRDPDALVDLVQPATLTRIVDASERALAQARQAGAAFAAELLDASPVELPDDEPQVVAERLAHEIVDPLRQRIEGALREGGGETDPSAAVGAAFRDWRGSRVEAVVGDFATWAFSGGAIAAAKVHGVGLEWVVDDGDTNCPDCEDNALSGAVEPGDEYPTGHLHPPIHPGCRCVLVPSVAR